MDSSMVVELRNSVKDTADRALLVASKWSSELLLSVPTSKRLASPFSALAPPSTQESTQTASQQTTTSHVPSSHPHAPKLYVRTEEARAQEAEWEVRDEDILATARACILSSEFLRAVHLLRECQSTKGRFLSLYSQFLATEKKTSRDWHKLDNNRHQPPGPVNTSLIELLEVVRNATDPWLLFLKALFLSRLSRREEAIESALLSMAGYPWNWSLWSLLGSCISDGEELSSLLPLLPLPTTHPLLQMFQVKTLNELHNPSEHELALCDRLLGEDFFPRSLWLMSLRAGVLYHLHDYPQAELQFERILQLDPYRIDDIDIYSNILYVSDNRIRLSRLAQEFLALDKDRPEVCCLVGNHYAMRADHEKAVKYFQRATELDRTYLSAWTLMGHEYVEMKNSHAAVEAYRRAADVNRKDYRAWYGLGQAYELLNMHQYALHYYQRATALRPYDVRLWQAQAMCYEELGRFRDSIECHKRALIGADPHEIKIKANIARLYHIVDEYAEAIAYHRRVIEICRTDRRPVQDYSRSCIYIAFQHTKELGGDLDLAKECLEMVANSNAEEVAQATEMLKKVKSMMASRAYEETREAKEKAAKEGSAASVPPV